MTSETSFDLSRLLQPHASVADGDMKARRSDGLDLFRLRLAVRGWTSPADSLHAKDGGAPLEALAAEVETAAENRPGQWFLSVASRRRALRSATDEMLSEAVASLSLDDDADPIRSAVKYWHLGALPRPETMTEDILSAYLNVIDWLGPRWNGPFSASDLAAEIARRTRNADIGRLTRYPLVGASHRSAVATLVKFARGRDDERRAIYVHGTGGVGKTTVLAFFERELRKAHPEATVLRIDFDDVAIDPTRSVTLNLALVDQLASAVENLRPWAGDVAMSLRKIATVQRRSRRARGSLFDSPDLESEKMRSRSHSDQGSILYDMLSPSRLPPGPLVLVLDTAELVLSHSDHISAAVASWFEFLLSEGGVRGLRLVIAGRDPPPAVTGGSRAMVHLLDRLAEIGISFVPPVHLDRLEAREAAELLANCGVTDLATANAAAHSVPGNPLLLRVTADALDDGDPAIREAVHAAHSENRVDAASARNYLMRRLVAHVVDPEARPYVLAALHLPMLSRAAVLHAVIPAVDRALGRTAYAGGGRRADGEPDAAATRFANRVFAALAKTHWLTRPSLDRNTIAFNRDLRDFAIGLLRAIPDQEMLERDVRQGAALHHSRRRSVQDSAFEYYHRAMLGIPFGKVANRGEVRLLLRDVLEELPPAARAYLGSDRLLYGDRDIYDRDADTVLAAMALPEKRLSDNEWRHYLEGDGKSAGEGGGLVGADRAGEALQIYTERPTREEGRPPTFVLRALAELGEWNHPLVDLPAVLEENETVSSGDRMYWAIRLALLQGEGRVAPRTIDRLVAACGDARGSALALLPSLAAVVELGLREPILPIRMRQAAAKSGVDTRPMLDAFMTADVRSLSLRLSAIAVVQRDWMKRVEERGSLRFALDRPRLGPIESQLAELQGRPLAAVNELFGQWKDRLPIRLDRLSSEDRRFLLRGQTPELHRPLREALLKVAGNELTNSPIDAICMPVLEAMSIRPAEMDPHEFFVRLEGNPRAWFSALVGFADQCRLLPLLARGIIDHAGPGNAARIARCYLAWDEIIGGGTSLWRREDF